MEKFQVYEVVECANTTNVKYGLVGRYGEENLNEKRHDIDIMVKAEDISMFERILIGELISKGYVLINYIKNDYSHQIFLYRWVDAKFLQVDLLTALTYRGLPYLNISLAINNIVNVHGLPVINRKYTGIYSVFRNVLWGGVLDHRYEEMAKEALYDKNNVLHKMILNMFGISQSAQLIKAICGDKKVNLKGCKTSFVIRSLIRKPYSSFCGLLKHYWMLVLRFYQYPGYMIVVLGPDGSGKSSVINALLAKQKVFSSSTKLHLYPGFLPCYGRLRKKRRVKQPHQLAPRGMLQSILKLLLWYIEYSFGYFFRLWKPLEEGQLIVFDRYYHDILVDPKRYRFQGSNWLAAFFSNILPKPDLWILLDVPSDVLQKRKCEVAYEESDRQKKEYLQLFARLNNSIVIDGSQSLENVVDVIHNTILVRLEMRVLAKKIDLI